jgi:hypothetical protein
MRRLSIALMVVCAWLIAALAFDRLVLEEHCRTCASAAALELKFRLPAAEVTYPPVSLLVLLVIPMVALALSLVPWRDLRSRQAWTHAIESWWEPWFWLGVALLLAIAGESVYILAREYLPKSVSELAQRFSVAGLVSVDVPGYRRTTPLVMTATLAGLTGLAIGAYLFLQNGLNGVMRWFKA